MNALDLTCPCEDGLPDPCTVCGVGASDGACELDRVNAERQSDAYTRGRADAFAEAIRIVEWRQTDDALRCMGRGPCCDAILTDLQACVDGWRFTP